MRYIDSPAIFLGVPSIMSAVAAQASFASRFTQSPSGCWERTLRASPPAPALRAHKDSPHAQIHASLHALLDQVDAAHGSHTVAHRAAQAQEEASLPFPQASHHWAQQQWAQQQDEVGGWVGVMEAV